MTTYNLESSMVDRANFEAMVVQGAEGMLETLPFNERNEDDAWQQDPKLYALVAFENFEIVAATIDSGEEATILVDDMAEAQALYAQGFPQAVRDWQKEKMVDHLEEEMSGDDGEGYVDFIVVALGGHKDGLAYNPVTVDLVGLEFDGNQIAYRQSDDATDGDWHIGSIEDAVEEALTMREQLAATEKEVVEMAARDMSSFTEMIAAAYKEEKAEEEKASAYRKQEDQTRIAEALADMDIIGGYAQDGDLIKFERLTIKAAFEFNHIEFKVQGECPWCNQTCWSDPASDLAGIGKMYIEFNPEYLHCCPQPQPQEPLTAKERLAEAIADLVNEAIEENI